MLYNGVFYKVCIKFLRLKKRSKIIWMLKYAVGFEPTLYRKIVKFQSLIHMNIRVLLTFKL